ncbi:MAG: hypothetical protein ACRDI2_13660 [Chloroflexota bacterium]
MNEVEKAHVMRQVGIRKMIVVEVSLGMKWHRNRSIQHISGISLAGARPAGQTVSGMDGDVSLVCCSRMELGKACPDTAARPGWWVNRERAKRRTP